jgi:hypothetical protein
MEKTVTMRMSEYENLLKCEDAVNKGHCVQFFCSGMGYEIVRVVSPNEVIERLNYELDKLKNKPKPKWYEIWKK